MKAVLTVVVATILLVLGLIGLVIPIIPGILFLIISAILFAQFFPPLHRQLKQHKTTHALLDRIEAGHQLDVISRIKLTFWSCLDAIIPRPKP